MESVHSCIHISGAQAFGVLQRASGARTVCGD